MADESHIWERREDETDKAWRAYRHYRDLPYKSSEHEDAPTTRSHKKVWELVYGRSPANIRYIEVWSSKYEWVRRVRAYDNYLEKREREAFENARVEDRAMRIRVNKALRQKLVEALSKAEIQQFGTQDIIRGLRYSNQELRKEYGDEPAQRVELTGKDGGPIEVEGRRNDLLATIEKKMDEVEPEPAEATG